MVGRSDAEILHNPRQLDASLHLAAWLMQRFGIQLGDVIGHNESVTSPYHHERYPRGAARPHGTGAAPTWTSSAPGWPRSRPRKACSSGGASTASRRAADASSRRRCGQRALPRPRAGSRRRRRAVAPDRVGRGRRLGRARARRRLLLVVAGGIVLVQAFARFVREGAGTPAPVAPTERLVVGGLYRYVRNPMYLAVAATIVGQALLLGSAVLLAYAALSSGSSSPSSAATRSRPWRGVTGRSTRPTVPRCRAGGRACVAARRVCEVTPPAGVRRPRPTSAARRPAVFAKPS